MPVSEASPEECVSGASASTAGVRIGSGMYDIRLLVIEWLARE